MHWIDGLGFCAAAAVLTSCCMTTILALRIFAVLSNVLFISYGLLGHIYPVFFLHIALLPVNLVKLHRLQGRSRLSKI
jgi:hypothetical protein